jgi:16S rRNA (uracil1498-N3)-methyltransferase
VRLTRVHVPGPLTAGSRHTLTGDAASHIARVLRLAAGDPLTVFDGRGGEHAARIEALRKGAIVIHVGERSADERESPLTLVLAQGVSRGERMDWVVQKATELGVTRIAPLLTERSVVRLDSRQAERKLQHWRGVAVAACEQCGRNRIPEIATPIGLDDFLRQVGEARSTRLLLSATGQLDIGEVPAPNEAVIVLIGPEGGLAPSEQGAARQAGFLAVRLGPRVLRTETAAVAALTLLQHRFGDLVS